MQIKKIQQLKIKRVLLVKYGVKRLDLLYDENPIFVVKDKNTILSIITYSKDLQNIETIDVVDKKNTEIKVLFARHMKRYYNVTNL